MKNNSYFFLLLLFFLTLFSCGRKGCTDQESYSYDSFATVDDGSCHYDYINRVSAEGNRLTSSFDGGVVISGVATADYNKDGDHHNSVSAVHVLKVNGAGNIDHETVLVPFGIELGSNNYSSGHVEFSDGGVLLASTGYLDSTQLLRLNPAHEELWTKKIDFRVNDLIHSNTNGFFLAGCIKSNSSNSNYDLIVQKIDADGYEIWTQTYPSCIAQRIVMRENGQVSVIAFRQSQSVGDVFLVNLDETGGVQSTLVMGEHFGYQSLPRVQKQPNGEFVSIYHEGVPALSTNSAVFNKMDSNGQLQWTREFEGRGGVYSSQGLFIVKGPYSDDSNERLSAFNDSGDVLWTHSFANRSISELIEDQDGNFILTGSIIENSVGKVWLAKIDPLGQFIYDYAL